MPKDLRNAAGVAWTGALRAVSESSEEDCLSHLFITSPILVRGRKGQDLGLERELLQLREGRQSCPFLLLFLVTELFSLCDLLVILRKTSIFSLSFHAREILL